MSAVGDPGVKALGGEDRDGAGLKEKEKEGNCWRALVYCFNERESWHTPSELLVGHVCLRVI